MSCIKGAVDYFSNSTKYTYVMSYKAEGEKKTTQGGKRRKLFPGTYCRLPFSLFYTVIVICANTILRKKFAKLTKETSLACLNCESKQLPPFPLIARAVLFNHRADQPPPPSIFPLLSPNLP